MKKLRVLLSIVAFFAASLGVYATEFAFVTQYYADNNPGTITGCDLPISPPECDGSTSVQCTTEESNLAIYKQVDSNPCQAVFRNQ